MLLRLANSSELPALASIGVAAFSTDSIYAHLYPFHKTYPKDFYNGILQSLQNVFNHPTGTILVAELEQSDITGSVETSFLHRPVGYMTLVRHGTGKDLTTQSIRIGDAPQHGSQSNGNTGDLTPNRAEAPETIRAYYEQVTALLGSLEKTLEARSQAILPELQRQGIGAKLMRRTMELGEEEGLPVVADTAENGKGISLFRRLGFEVIGRTVLPAKTVTIAGSVDVVDLREVAVLLIRRDPVMRTRSNL